MKPGGILLKLNLNCFNIISLLFCIYVVSAGVIHCNVLRFAMNPDGIAYMDIAQAYANGQWHHAVNPYWSPLYSWIIGLFFFLFQPGAAVEFQWVHGINFLILLFTAAGFDFFLTSLVSAVEKQEPSPCEAPCETPSASTWETACAAPVIALTAYLLFIKIVFGWIDIAYVTPDLLLCALVFWAYGVLVRIKAAKEIQPRLCMAYGALLGAAYLAKSVMFPLSALFLIAVVDFKSFLSSTAFSPYRAPYHAPYRGLLNFNLNLTAFKPLVISCGVFLGVSLPFVAAISLSEGKLTFGESGRINYAVCVNQRIHYIHLKGINGGEKNQINPPAIVHGSPEVAAYALPIKGTYPLHYNPVYWVRGISPVPDLTAQWHVLKRNIVKLFNMVRDDFAWLILSSLICFIWAGWRSLPLPLPLSLFLPAAAGAAIYLPVYILPRYSGPFVAVLILLLICSVKLPQQLMHRRVAGAVLLLFSIFMVRDTVVDTFQMLPRVFSDEVQHEDMQRARALHNAGILPGSALGIIGDPYYAYWARLGRFRIIADTFDRDAFDQATPLKQKGVIQAFLGAGVDAVVRINGEDDSSPPSWQGWQVLDDEDLTIYLKNNISLKR